MLTALLGILLLPLLASIAFCAAAETVLFSITPGELQGLGERSPGVAARLRWLRARPRALLVTVLLLANLVSVSFFVISTIVSERLGNPWLTAAFEVAMLLVVVLAGDLVPKLVARSRRVSIAPVLSWTLPPIYRVLSPVRAILEHGVVAPLVRLVYPPAAREPSAVSPEELGLLLETSALDANLLDHEQWLLGAVVDLGALRVRDVMTPRVDIRWLEAAAAPDDVLRALEASPWSVIPVARGSLDHGSGGARGVVGLLNVPQYLAVVVRHRARVGPGPTSLASFLDPVVYVPDRAPLDRVIEQLASLGTRFALCVDEWGDITGSVTSEQVLAPLLATPLDAPAHAASIRRIDATSWSVPGRMAVRQLAEYVLGPGFSGATRASGVTTVGGLVIAGLGRIPRVGDALRLGGVRLRVTEVDGRSVERVEVALAEVDAPPRRLSAHERTLPADIRAPYAGGAE